MSAEVSPDNAIVLLVTAQKGLAKKVLAFFQDECDEYTLEIVDNGIEGMNRICLNPPAVVLVDSTLSDISGLQMCRILKHDPTLRKLPLMMLTKESAQIYQNFSELALIADVFVEQTNLAQDFVYQFKTLMQIYNGLHDQERQHLNLLRTESVQVQAVSRLAQLLDQSITEVTLMKSFRQLFERIANRNVLNHMLFSLLENVVDYDLAAIFYHEKSREPRHLTFHTPHKGAMQEADLKHLAQTFFEDLKQKAPTVPAAVFDDFRHELIYPPSAHEVLKPLSLKEHQMYPFFEEGRLLGAIAFFNRQPANYDLIFPFELVMQEVLSLMRLRAYYSDAEALSITDPLTGLHTYQHFMWCLDKELRQAKRHSSPLTLALVSLDDFREVNTQWGFAMADELMKRLAAVSLESVRASDMLARVSSRKILALFPNTGPDSAMLAIERIKERFNEAPVKLGDQVVESSISIGVVGLSPEVHTATQFIEDAQHAAEAANRKGPNRIELVQ